MPYTVIDQPIDSSPLTYSQAGLRNMTSYFDAVNVLLMFNPKAINLKEANRDGMTIFALACREGRLDLITELLKPKYEEKIDLNQVDFRGRTPFYSACLSGSCDVLAELLTLDANRVDFNKTDVNGVSPFSVACSYALVNVLEELLKPEYESKIILNKADKDAFTVFIDSCNNLEVRERLNFLFCNKKSQSPRLIFS
jgi:hypothetical protein